MANGILHCYYCKSSFKFYSAHAGFGDEIYFYCNQCGIVATVDMYGEKYSPFQKKHVAVRSYNAQNEGNLKAFEKNFKKMKTEIASHLNPCSCGGMFTVDATPRCPNCKKELEWSKMVDQIDKASDSTTPNYFKTFIKEGWGDIYYFVFNDRIIRNNWKT